MRLLHLLFGLVLVGATACASTPDAPTAIDYNREACGHCHMLIGDPRFAAQIVTADGDVVSFDDPGCAIAYLAGAPAPRHVWFRDAHADRWLDQTARFEPATETPMGWGLAATQQGPLTLAQARAQVAARVTP